MTPSRSTDRLMALLAALGVMLALPACSTNDIGRAQVAINDSPTDPNQGALLLSLAPTAAAYDPQQTSSYSPDYVLFVDGKELAHGAAAYSVAFTCAGMDRCSAGYLDAGMHHFAIAPAIATEMTSFEGDGFIKTGAVTRLYLFGPLDARQGRFVSYPLEPTAANEHVSAINLVRSGGVQIEIVSCTAAATCTPVSPPLALGDTFDADFPPSAVLDAYGFNSLSLSTTGAGIGYRQVATPSLPAPPVSALSSGWLSVPAVNFVVAPVYMSSDGLPVAGFD